MFDFDGLLMDTETTLVASWQAEWERHGLELDLEDEFWPGHGGDTLEMHLRYAGRSVGPGTTARRATRGGRRIATGCTESLDFLPGIRAWLREARELGLKVAIASSSDRGLGGRASGAGRPVELFDLVVTGDEVSTHKPDPEMYLLALARLGLPGSAAVAVEDTAHGVAAAAAAGMATIAIPNPFVGPEAVSAADLVLTSADRPTLEEGLLAVSRSAVSSATLSREALTAPTGRSVRMLS